MIESAQPTPEISVIITTHARPDVVGRAVSSALRQTIRDIEVIVVIDGPSQATEAALRSVEDPRLRWRVRDERGGQPAAINDGIRMARGRWTALLDDDDEWLEDKLEVQLKTARSSDHGCPVVACYFLARSELGDIQWPCRPPRPRERTGDYLFCRSRLIFGDGILPTSILFAATELFRREPMDEKMPVHCDMDWVIRVDSYPDVGLEMPADERPLSIWHQEGLDRMSRKADWRYSYRWIELRRALVSRRAYAGFLLTWVGPSARQNRDFKAFPFLLKEAFFKGRPGLRELAIYFAFWVLPLDLRVRLSGMLAIRNESPASP